jgi:uracil-DNA glycosylase
LLNAILTVQAWKPTSHAKIWWEDFTDSVIKTISNKKKWIIFLLWWAFAQSKKKLIDTKKHIILETTHPSPFSAYRWFLGSGCFVDVNKILKERWEDEIDWEIK